MGKKSSIPVHRPKTQAEFSRLNSELNKRGFMALDALKPGEVRSLTLGDKDPSINGASDLAACIGTGAWSNGPLSKVAWQFDNRDNAVQAVTDKDGKPMGLGYVKWGPGNCTPSVIPPLAMSSPYTAAPLRYIADLTAGLGPAYMYRLPDGRLVDFKDAGDILLSELHKAEKNKNINIDIQVGKGRDSDIKEPTDDEVEEKRRRYEAWKREWQGYDVTDGLGIQRHVIGAKEFLEENNLNLHLSQCEQDDVMLDIYFPTVGFDYKGIRGEWRPVISRIGFLPAHSTRLEKMDDNRYIHHCYFSDSLRTLGAATAQVVEPGSQKFRMYPAAMPQDLLHELRYTVSSNQKTAASKRPMWIVCPTFYPSLNKPYYPQPAWWSVFTSKAFDFSSTILYDKAKQRENRTSWGKIVYISLDYLEQVFADEGYVGNKEAQQEFVDELERSMEEFLQHRENHGKMMRQWMWTGQGDKEHHNVEIVDIAESTKDEATAGKEELELSTSPIFLALQVDPRLVGVPMVHSSNGGTALREMALLKQQQLNVKQRLYLDFLNSVARFNGWTGEFHIKQQTFTTLDNSKTGTVETIAGEGS